MFAIIETGGKQYIVKKGDKVQIEKLEGKAGDTVKFEKVLLTSDGASLQVGKPFLTTPVEAKIINHGKGEKIRIFKYKAKSKYRKAQGHRQNHTEVEITKI
ncbi:MAG: 50S ribosomal protein L21 [Candidatus Doudnabacteria bacterium]|nr:50S ribosomal protein L21 [Candidatus Doudnabacteria bacterium]